MHGLLAAKGEGDVDVLGQAEQVADLVGELLEAGTALLHRDSAHGGDAKHGEAC